MFMLTLCKHQQIGAIKIDVKCASCRIKQHGVAQIYVRLGMCTQNYEKGALRVRVAFGLGKPYFPAFQHFFFISAISQQRYFFIDNRKRTTNNNEPH